MNNCVISVVSFGNALYKYSVIPNSNPTLQPLWRSNDLNVCNDSYVFIFTRLIYISVVYEKNIIKGMFGV